MPHPQCPCSPKSDSTIGYWTYLHQERGDASGVDVEYEDDLALKNADDVLRWASRSAYPLLPHVAEAEAEIMARRLR